MKKKKPHKRRKHIAPAGNHGLGDAEQGHVPPGMYQAVATRSDSEPVDPYAHDVQEVEPVPLDEDLYGFAACALMKDTHFLAEPDTKGGQKRIRYVRLSISLVLIVGNTLLQVYLMYNIKKYITSATVINARSVYDKFEAGMYDETTRTVNGNHRGVPGGFNPRIFDDLDESEKEEVCQIPLSQPHFLLVFIFLWSLTCLSDVKTGLAIAYKFFFTIPTVSSMKDALVRVPDDPLIRNVVGITWGVRWLIATNCFSDLFLNAVALAFVFDLKDILYNQLLPVRNKRDVQNTLFPPSQRFESASLGAYIKGLLIAPVTMGWSLYYVYMMQAVLPHYGWDIHDVCKTWLIKHYTV